MRNIFEKLGSRAILGFLFGLSIGTGLSQFWVGIALSDIVVDYELSAVAKTNLNLAYAASLREGDHKKMIEHYESGIQTNVLVFTEDGKKIPELSENDQCALEKVRKYWLEQCEKQCFIKIAHLLKQEFRITSSCTGSSLRSSSVS